LKFWNLGRGYEVLVLIYLAQDSEQWQGLLNMAMKSWVTKRWEFLEYLIVWILKKDSGVGSNLGTT
jgi:hypothetical protein